MEYVIQTEHLTRAFGSKVAVNQLNLNVPRGSVYGFLGPNGAGKTTTIRMLLGLATPTSGTATVLGHPVSSKKQLPKIGFLPDVPNYYNWMRGEEFLMFAGKLFEIPHPELKQRTGELLEITGLKGVKTKIGGYSRGMKQRLGLAQALINDPDLIFLDEPTSALDPIGRKEMLEAIKILSEKCTVFFSTHILSDVERICDYVAVLKQGNLVTEEPIQELRKKFAQSALSIEVTEHHQEFIKTLEQKEWTQVVEKQNGSILLTAFDLSAAQREIPRIVTDLNIGLKKLEPVELDLEDIFVRLVNGNE